MKNNILEITNECFYLILVGLLSYFNSESRWKKSIEISYLGIILCNSLVIICILIVSFMITIFIKCKKCCSKIRINSKENKMKENKTNEKDISVHSGIRNSVLNPSRQIDRESDIRFYEESKHEISIPKNQYNISIQNEINNRNYNQFYGFKLAKR